MNDEEAAFWERVEAMESYSLTKESQTPWGDTLPSRVWVTICGSFGVFTYAI